MPQSSELSNDSMPSGLRYDGERLTANSRKPVLPTKGTIGGAWRAEGTARDIEKEIAEAGKVLYPMLNANNKLYLLDIFNSLKDNERNIVLGKLHKVYKNKVEAEQDGYKKTVDLLEKLLVGTPN